MFSWSNYNERNYLRYPYEFQGFVIHDVWNQDYCFLESVSKDSPFLFENESQILYIRSSYFEIGRRDRSCKWKFSAPDGYGFKIVVAELYLNSDILLAVTNSTNYYIVKIEFGAYITIVKTKFKIVDAKCTATGGDINVWTNINYLNPNGYPNNALCLYEIAVPKNTFISALRTDEFQEEINADTTTYYDEYSETWHDWSDDDLKGGQVFLPYSNGTTRKIKWKFSSDGSVRNGGFRIEFNKICT
uniref:CUB domain-containing protein n=1 Tax=Panagrolaimus davidi TaxID=227884 RepID=A0A914QNY7_9BILA